MQCTYVHWLHGIDLLWNAWQSSSRADDDMVMCIRMSISYQVECIRVCWSCLCYIRWQITQIRYEHPIHIFSVFFPFFSSLLFRACTRNTIALCWLIFYVEKKIAECFQMESWCLQSVSIHMQIGPSISRMCWKNKAFAILTISCMHMKTDQYIPRAPREVHWNALIIQLHFVP